VGAADFEHAMNFAERAIGMEYMFEYILGHEKIEAVVSEGQSLDALAANAVLIHAKRYIGQIVRVAVAQGLLSENGQGG
jgi:hypothetical protein